MKIAYYFCWLMKRKKLSMTAAPSWRLSAFVAIDDQRELSEQLHRVSVVHTLGAEP